MKQLYEILVSIYFLITFSSIFIVPFFYTYYKKVNKKNISKFLLVIVLFILFLPLLLYNKTERKYIESQKIFITKDTVNYKNLSRITNMKELPEKFSFKFQNKILYKINGNKMNIVATELKLNKNVEIINDGNEYCELTMKHYLLKDQKKPIGIKRIFYEEMKDKYFVTIDKIHIK